MVDLSPPDHTRPLYQQTSRTTCHHHQQQQQPLGLFHTGASTRREYTAHIDASEFQWLEIVHMPIEALAQVALFWPI